MQEPPWALPRDPEDNPSRTPTQLQRNPSLVSPPQMRLQNRKQNRKQRKRKEEDRKEKKKKNQSIKCV